MKTKTIFNNVSRTHNPRVPGSSPGGPIESRFQHGGGLLIGLAVILLSRNEML